MDLVLKINHDDYDRIRQEAEFQQLAPDIVETRALDGASLVAILVPLTTATAGYVAKIVIELIRARKEVEVLVDGKKIKGLSADDAVKVLRALTEHDPAGPSTRAETAHDG
jgi:hypothetical protein